MYIFDTKGEWKMSIRKRLTAFASAAALFITMLPASVSAHDGEHKIYKGSYVFYDKAIEGNYDATFYYSDAYFARPGTQMDEHLRTMSLNLALASADKDTEGNLYDILRKTGFDSETVQSDEMDEHTKDTIGTVIANKTTDEGKKLVVVVFNGMRYGAEWENNLTVGASGDAEGFSSSASKAFDRLVKYINDNDLKGAKLWITGYSRGGAVADMTGKLINENLEELGITQDDLYDYTFATPRASEKALGYANIHDIIDPYDIIPRLMPKGWGIDRAGTEYLIPCAEQTVQPKIINVGHLMLGTDLIIDKTEEREDPETGEKETVPVDPIPADKFLDDFSKLLSDNITRESYDAERDSIPALVTRLILTSSSDYSLITFIADTFKGAALSLLQPAYNLLYNPIDSQEYKQTMEELPATLAEILDSSENKDKISKEDFELTKKALPAMLRVFVPAIKGDTTDPIDLTKSFEKIATLIGSIKPIITNHFSSSYYAKLTALDSYYTEKRDVDRGRLRYFNKDYQKVTDEEMEKLGLPQKDIDLIKNGYDVIYQTNYDVFEENNVKDEDKTAIAELFGRKPDLAIYFGSNPTRTQTFGKPEAVELEEGFTLKLAVVPGEDEHIGKNGVFKLASYKDGKAEMCDATFEFNDQGQLTVAYPYKKDTFNAIVYLENKPAESLRIWGNNRYETAMKAADKFKEENKFDKFPALIVATGTEYADALSAAYLAKAKNAPMILTNNQSAVQKTTLDYIHANCDKNTQIYLIGGEGVISLLFQKKLTTSAPSEQQYNVKRLAGNNRYETNIAILQEAGVKDEELIIASGLDYADALSASAAGKPILLAAGKLTDKQQEYIKSLTSENAVIAGGTGAVSEAVETTVKGVFKNTERIGGKTRFETSKLIAEKYFDKPQAIALAYALDFPDGLVAAPLTNIYNCPILLVTDKNFTAAADYAKAAGADKSVTFGGTGVIADETVTNVVPAK